MGRRHFDRSNFSTDVIRGITSLRPLFTSEAGHLVQMGRYASGQREPTCDGLGTVLSPRHLGPTNAHCFQSFSHIQIS